MGNAGWPTLSYDEIRKKVIANSYIDTNEGDLGEVKLTGMIMVTETKFSKTFLSLQTETEYFLNGYFVQNFKKVSNATTVNFTTLGNDFPM